MYPDFLGIGAQKSGTTWLYEALNAHPEIFMTPVKEIHYFDLQRPQNRKRHPHRDVINIPRRYLGTRRAQLLNRGKNALLETVRGQYSLDRLLWDIRYQAGLRNDEWYQSLFPKKPGRIAGEITPAYAILQDELVAEIAALMPRAKIIYMIRNPIERAWSSAVTTVPKGQDVGATGLDHFIAAFNRPQARARDDFIGAIDRWTRYFSARQIFVGFLDEVESDPAAFLKRLYGFLGVSPGDAAAIPAAVRTGKRSGSQSSIPPAAAKYLAEMHYAQIQELDRRYGAPASAWLAEADALRRAG